MRFVVLRPPDLGTGFCRVKALRLKLKAKKKQNKRHSLISRVLPKCPTGDLPIMQLMTTTLGYGNLTFKVAISILAVVEVSVSLWTSTPIYPAKEKTTDCGQPWHQMEREGITPRPQKWATAVCECRSS